MQTVSFLSALRREALEAPASGIVEVMNYGRTKPGLIPLWVGEGDRPTPGFIVEAAARSMQAGETFYTWQRGLPELRQALARYHMRVYGRTVSAERFFVTGSGMQALQLAVRMIAGHGDEVLLPTPAWPNFSAALGIAGARPVSVPMALEADGWHLDLDRLAAAVSPATKAIVVNSPSNPTGWTASADDIRALLELARRHGLWIIADEIYGRFVHDGSERAPSFRDQMKESDRVLFIQTFSKNWAMTGWRIGWLEAPPELGSVIENLIQYSTSGVAAFMQRGAIAALEDGEPFVREQIASAARGAAIVSQGLAATGRVTAGPPMGAFYHFFSVEGEADSQKLAIRLVDEANVGLAPGTAFGAGAETFLRLCYARAESDLVEATRRLVEAIGVPELRQRRA